MICAHVVTMIVSPTKFASKLCCLPAWSSLGNRQEPNAFAVQFFKFKDLHLTCKCILHDIAYIVNTCV